MTDPEDWRGPLARLAREPTSAQLLRRLNALAQRVAHLEGQPAERPAPDGWDRLDNAR